ncbi:MAG: HAMP domain-containing histidine kinase [Candidatus Eisenbacteria bacterium]|uniref:histidine kinase n=1 Tax=Eiseniibacteriota bacterium TaxID=2212470 RepID=A0A948RUG7_UNCEI|nr:HAMP domain-containing histidine kinase [Candidatus Eisenbacteria bacterium]MBU1947145.1 HAMP domain-containing histidine kinase [Candidatus Eisenbacteria bacterium]MBU2691235.1 HAMP domain-containing histidine kinase [Candidatus Eisenbacteria bacterium]
MSGKETASGGTSVSSGWDRPLRLYVGAVILASVGILCASFPSLHEFRRADLWIWLIICIGAEFLWLETISGEGSDSMASTVNFAAIYLLDLPTVLFVVPVSVFIATRFVQKRNFIKSLFGFSQMIVTIIAAGSVFRWTGGLFTELEVLRHPMSLLPCLAAGTVYTVVNSGLVACAVSLENKSPLFKTWRVNFGYRNYIFSSVALFILSPLLVIAYLAVGYWGVLLFFLPMFIIKNQNREYIELQRTTHALISSERMAARGEMAAEISHELGNYLAILSGRAQLLSGRAMRAGDAAMAKDAQTIKDQVANMTVLTKGLLDHSHRDVKPQDTDLNELTSRTVEFLKPQNRFDKIELRVELGEGIGDWFVDAGQIQQVLINLIKNSADAILGEGRAEGVIHIYSEVDANGGAHLIVEDDGPGIPENKRDAVFEPGVTTKPDGHGFGLYTCLRILENHGGKIWVDASPLGGAQFHLSLPGSRKAA